MLYSAAAEDAINGAVAATATAAIVKQDEQIGGPFSA
jgi:hypothetical protein